MGSTSAHTQLTMMRLSQNCDKNTYIMYGHQVWMKIVSPCILDICHFFTLTHFEAWKFIWQHKKIPTEATYRRAVSLFYPVLGVEQRPVSDLFLPSEGSEPRNERPTRSSSSPSFPPSPSPLPSRTSLSPASQPPRLLPPLPTRLSKSTIKITWWGSYDVQHPTMLIYCYVSGKGVTQETELDCWAYVSCTPLCLKDICRLEDPPMYLATAFFVCTL